MILQTTGGFSDNSFADEVFPLGSWCSENNLSLMRTASNLNSSSDLDVRRVSEEIIDWLESWVYESLNEIHGVSFAPATWFHSLGTYFRVLVPLLIERYNLVKRSIEQVGCSEFTHVEMNGNEWIPNTRNELQILINSHGWNHYVIGLMCEQMGLTKRSPKEFDEDLLRRPTLMVPPGTHPNRSWKLLPQKICNLISRHSRVVITQTLLPKRMELELCIRNRTLPFFWTDEFQYSNQVDFETRKRLKSALSTTNSVHHIIGSIATSFIPRLYVEDFGRLRKQLHRKLPRHSKFIFTSNLHMASEEFLLWIAEKKQEGSWVSIGQHGGVHCLAREMPAEVAAEIELADTYLAWGKFATQIPRGVSAPILVNVGTPETHNINHPNHSDITIVLDSPYRYPSMPRGMSADRYDYAQSINLILREIGANEGLRIRLRLHRATNEVGDPLLPLLATPANTRIDHGVGSIEDVYMSSRLIITTSIGTTFFQTLHRNIPTVMLINEKGSSLSSWASDELVILREASILFSDEKDLSMHLSKLSNNFETWWQQRETQNARSAFLNTFSISTESDTLFYQKAILPCRSARVQ